MAIIASGDPRAETVLTAFLEGELYTTRAERPARHSGRRRRRVRDSRRHHRRGLRTVGRRDVSRVTVNNQLRGALRSMLASLKLRHEDPDERSAAIREVGESEDLAMLETLEQLLATEQHGGVRSCDRDGDRYAESRQHGPGGAPRRHRGRQHERVAHVRTKLTAIAADAAIDDGDAHRRASARWTASSAAWRSSSSCKPRSSA